MIHIHVSVYPDSRREMVKELSKSRLHIYVKEPAEGNRANRRVLEIVREKHPGSMVRMVKGHHSPSKILSIESKKRAP
jgi:uncharacterized protein (TIGR00251 family)